MAKHIPDIIKVVLFDHDDTLVDTIGTKWAQHKYVAKLYYDKELTDAEITEHWGKPLPELVGLLYGTDDVEQAIKHNTAHHQEFEKVLFKATVPTLKHLKDAGKLVGIVTATTRFSFEHDLKLHGISPELLDYRQSGDDTLFHKPDKRVFEPATKWLDAKGILPEETLYIGDGLHDMKAALGAGFNFLGVETGLVTARQFATAGAKSIPSIAHLL